MGIPGFPFSRGFRDPVVIIETPFSTKTADDTGDAYDSGGYSQLSGKEWPSVKWPIQVVEIMYVDRRKVRAKKIEGLVKSCTLTSRVLTEDYHSQLTFTTACAISSTKRLHQLRD